jgi:Tol biopolymer transport system component
VVPLAGGSPKTLLEVHAPEALWGGQARAPIWTPDGRGLLMVKIVGGIDGPKELLLVPADGGLVKKLNLDISRWKVDGGFRLSPDGRQIAFVGTEGAPGDEIRAIEGLVPTRRAQR